MQNAEHGMHCLLGVSATHVCLQLGFICRKREHLFIKFIYIIYLQKRKKKKKKNILHMFLTAAKGNHYIKLRQDLKKNPTYTFRAKFTAK